MVVVLEVIFHGDLTDPNLNDKSCKYPFGKLDLVFQV